LKSGDEIVIDRIVDEDLSNLSLITDTRGSVVGFFRYSSSKAGIFVSARSAYTIYVLKERGLVPTSAEVRCAKADSRGEPNLGVSRARWDDDQRELTFDVRSSCGIVDFFGGQRGREVLNLTPLSFADALKSESYTEEEKRVRVSLRDGGEIASVNVDDARRQE